MRAATCLLVASMPLVILCMSVLANAELNNMKINISTDKSVYVRGEKIRIYLNAKDTSGNAVSSALVQLAFTNGQISYAMERTFTDKNGITVFKVVLPKKMSSGEYSIFAIVTKPGFNQGTGIGKFNVF